jgi:hypothetical protein
VTRAAAAALIAGALLCSPVHAQDPPSAPPGYVTAKDLYRDCHPASTQDPAQLVAYVKCIGYIDGAASMARIYTLSLKLNELCIPPGTQTIQIMDVVLGYIAANPAVKDAQGSIAVYGALKSAYPCPAQ